MQRIAKNTVVQRCSNDDLLVTRNTALEADEHTPPEDVQGLLKIVSAERLRLKGSKRWILMSADERISLKKWEWAYWRLVGVNAIREIRKEAAERRREAALAKRREQERKRHRKNRAARRSK